MRIDVLTLFPEMFSPLNESILGRAVESGKLEIFVHDIRDYSLNKHKKTDADYAVMAVLLSPPPMNKGIGIDCHILSVGVC